MRYFEDIAVGDRREIGRHTFTAEEIKSFAQRFDPQPFHLDEEAAARSHFGALVASGWHTAAVFMKLLIDFNRRANAQLSERGEPIARTGPSPGFSKLNWLKPVYVGDTIAYASEVIDKRVSASRPEWGIIISHNTGTNQKGELVYEFQGVGFVERRGAPPS
jgi:acyl dehydratase